MHDKPVNHFAAVGRVRTGDLPDVLGMMQTLGSHTATFFENDTFTDLDLRNCRFDRVSHRVARLAQLTVWKEQREQETSQ